MDFPSEDSGVRFLLSMTTTQTSWKKIPRSERPEIECPPRPLQTCRNETVAWCFANRRFRGLSVQRLFRPLRRGAHRDDSTPQTPSLANLITRELLKLFSQWGPWRDIGRDFIRKVVGLSAIGSPMSPERRVDPRAVESLVRNTAR